MADLTTEEAANLRARFAACVERETGWRQKALKDLKFKSGGEDQWDDVAKAERTQFGQPMFTVNRMGAFIKQVTNQYRLSSPTIHVVPAGEEGDEDTAQVFEGVIRYIRNISDGEIADDTAFESAATIGKGFAYVTVDYVDEDSNQQDILIKRVRNPFTVYCGPANEPDFSDMRYAFVTDLVPEDDFRAEFGDDAADSASDLAGVGDAQKQTWYPKGYIRLVEYFEAVMSRTKKGRAKVKYIRWRKINGVGRVLSETKFPITRIPIVPMLGDEFDIDGELDYRGMVRDGRDPQRILNWTFTYLIEQLSVAPKSPFLVSATQLENFEDIWKLANRRNFPYLPYNDKDAEGRPTGQPPIRNSIEPPIQGTVAALLMSENQYKAVMQLYDPSLGQRKTDQSGKAVLALQQQGEIGNSNYSDNAKRYQRSLGRLLIEMIPKYYDAPRVLRILGRDDQPKRVMIHANKDNQLPDVMPDGVEKIYNLGVGRYDVTVSTGPSFINKQQEQLATLMDLVKADPQVMPLLADLIAQKMGADDVVERLRKIDPLKSLLAQDQQQGPTIDQVKGQLQNLMQQHDALVKELNAKNQVIETDQVKFNYQYRIETLKQQTAMLKAQADNETKLAVAELGAKVDRLGLFMEERSRLWIHAHEAAQADLDRQHKADLAAQQQQADQQQQDSAQSSEAEPPPDEAPPAV